MVLYLHEDFLHIKDTCLGLCHLALSLVKLYRIFLFIFLLFKIVSPTSNRYAEPIFTSLGSVMLFSKISHICFHSIVLLFKVSILAHNFILNSLSTHSIYSCFFDNWVVNFLSHFKALADACTVLENHIDIILHGIEVSKVHVEVIEKVRSVTEYVLTHWGYHVIIHNSLPAYIVSHVTKLRFFDQTELLFFNHKTVIHVSNEFHKLSIGVYKCIWNLIKNNLLWRWLWYNNGARFFWC